jgi:hypothetical protein
MEITAEEAIDLLKKWHEEKRELTCSMFSATGKAVQVAMIVGRIKSVSPDAVRIESSYGPSEVRACTYIEIPLPHARYEYSEPKLGQDPEISDVLTEAGVSRLVESQLRVHEAGGYIAFSLVVVSERIKLP